jgi:hypothetical protein
MGTTKRFKLTEFAAHDDHLVEEVKVCIPQTAFRIHPEKSHMMGLVILKRFEDNWYLVHPQVAKTFQMPHLWRAALYEGVKSNGASFVLPLTNARPGRENRYDSLKEAINDARRQWIRVESDHDQDTWAAIPQASKQLAAVRPTWFEGGFSALIELAFRGRIIRTVDEAMAICPKQSHRNYSDDDEDS